MSVKFTSIACSIIECYEGIKSCIALCLFLYTFNFPHGNKKKTSLIGFSLHYNMLNCVIILLCIILCLFVLLRIVFLFM